MGERAVSSYDLMNEMRTTLMVALQGSNELQVIAQVIDRGCPALVIAAEQGLFVVSVLKISSAALERINNGEPVQLPDYRPSQPDADELAEMSEATPAMVEAEA
jgi:hypothetical protein